MVMAAYNAAAYLPAAIDSILSQTFTDFEFIIIDDGSSDSTPEIIRGYSDPRIRAVRNPRNLGLIGSLNRGLDLARGEFIARMDADDEALTNRFEEQIRFLDAHPDVSVCGSEIETFGARIEHWELEHQSARIKCRLIFEPSMCHPTVIFRRSTVIQHELRYDEEYPHAEDYALWVRFASVSRIVNLPKVLVRYRLHEDSVSHAHRRIQHETIDRVRREQLHRLGLNPSEREFEVHTTIMRGSPYTLTLNVDEVETWLIRLMAANREHEYLDRKALGSMLYESWFKICRAHRGNLTSASRRFLRSSISHAMPWPNRLADAIRLFMASRIRER